MAKVPHGHGERGVSSCTAILSTRLYRGSGGGGMPRELNDAARNLCIMFCRFPYWAGEG